MSATPSLLYSTLGHYQLLREAGRGGMSMVYEAVDNRIGRRVALKVLALQMPASPEAQDARVARFKREARAIARLSHPNIVAVYDIGDENGQHFIVMEFLEGETLRERTTQGPVAPQKAAVILRQVAAGLDAVHAAGIVHRDIKPSNVMLLPDGQVKLMDFGVARQHEDTLVTQAGAMVGSPVYMSPEQANGAEHGTATDLWSLGVILYEMLAGRAPFVGGSIPNVLYQVAHATPAPLPDASPSVQQVLDRALDKNPARRFGSGKEMADAFESALAVPAPPAAVRAVPSPAAAPRVPRKAAGGARGRRVGAGALLLALGAVGLLALAPRPVAHGPLRPHQARSVSAGHRAVPHHTAASHTLPALSPVRSGTRQARAAFARRTHARHGLPAALRAVVAAAPHARLAAPLAARPAVRVVRTPVRPAERISVRPVPRVSVRPAERTRVHIARAPAPSPAPPYVPRVRVSVLPVPPAAGAQGAAGAPNVLGAWHGTNARNPATLMITHSQGNTFAGTMNVRTHEANVRIAVTGHVSPKTGAMTMRETQVISASKPRAWDLGRESGHMNRSGKMTGTGTDTKGRSGTWSFAR